MKNYYQFINESKKDKLKKYPVLIPPTDKEELVQLMIDNFKKQLKDDPNTKSYFGVGDDKPCGKEELENGEFEEMVRKVPIKALQHEAVHFMQSEKYDDMWDDMPTGDKFWDSIFDNDDSHKKYLSMPSEIMAYAFSYVVDDDSVDDLKDKSDFIKKPSYEKYEEIGGNVFDLYKHYIEEYKESLDK